jgi:hypothetical protein
MNIRKGSMFYIIHFISISLIILTSCNQKVSNKPTKEISKKEIYEMQERCGKQCAKIFIENGGSNIEDKDVATFKAYECHYNSKLNKCFMLNRISVFIKREKLNRFIEDLWDINENKLYGMFRREGKNVKDCRVGKNTLEQVLGISNNCQSQQDWETLIKPFMEE